MKTLLLGAVAILALTACSPTPEDIAKAKALNSAAAADPTIIANLPDGRPIRVIRVDNPQSTHWHYVYYIDNAVVSANNTYQSGKSTANEAIVTLSANATPDDVIAYADRLKEAQRVKDEAELARIKARGLVQ